MESQVGMETTLFGGPPEIGNNLKLANGQIGFMGIFAHPLFANVTDVIPAMGFAAAEILNNKGVWISRIEQEKGRHHLLHEGGFNDGAVSPRSQSPPSRKPDKLQVTHPQSAGYFPASPLRHASNPPSPLQQHVKDSRHSSVASTSHAMTTDDPPIKQSKINSWNSPSVEGGTMATSNTTPVPQEVELASSGVFPSERPHLQARRPEVRPRRSSNTVPSSLQVNGVSDPRDESRTTTTASSERGGDEERKKVELVRSDYTATRVPLVYDDSVPALPDEQVLPEQKSPSMKKSLNHAQIVPVSKYSPVLNRPFSQPQNQRRNSGRMSVPFTSDHNSMLASGGQTYSTTLSTTLSPSVEPTSFLSIESSDEQIEDHGNGSWNSKTKRCSDRGRTKSSPSTLPEVVPSTMVGRGPPTVSRNGGRTKSPIKTSMAMVKEPGQETVRTWEENYGDRSMKRRISRFKFWRKKTDEDESQ